ncbi:CDP-glycerol glycerophosphotransferase family protein [Enterococcus lactis]|nr:CDP-glycerol glycerophosphotransferase family protein [Enterococcus lactis]
MKEKFIKKIKYSKILFKLLNFFGNLFFGVIKYLVPINNKRVLLVSYGGRRFDDSPKAILDNLINDSRFKNYEFVIAIKEYDSIEKNTLIYNNLKNIRIVKIDTFIYFYMVMSSRIWITNSAIERSFTFIKKKKNIYVNTWHGTPIKKWEQI